MMRELIRRISAHGGIEAQGKVGETVIGREEVGDVADSLFN